MSLFSTKDWWSTRVSATEEFDDRHLVTANIDNNTKNDQQIIVGSFSGYLRVYSPAKGEYQVPHLLLEQFYQEPIIQIAAGKVSPFSNETALVILFFKKIVVVSFQNSSIGLQSKVLYQHGLERNAYNMILGQFGQQEKDLVCVQSCDGMLTIYEHDKLSCYAQLSKFLLPGPIAYNLANDSFVIFNSSYELESYKYQNILSSFTQNKKLVPDWQLNIGEQTLGIQCAERKHKIIDYVLLTEEAMYIVTQQGTIRLQKKFEYPCANFTILDIPEKRNKYVQDKRSNEQLSVLTILISSFTNNLLLYEEFELLWATKTEHTAHAMTVGNFKGTRGLIVTLNDEGWLQASYLGTNQAPNVSQFETPKKEISYEEMDNKYHELIEQIQKKEGGGKGKGNQNRESQQEQLNINVQQMGTFISDDYIEKKELYYLSHDDKIIATKLRVSLTYNGLKATSVQIFLNLPQNLVTSNNNKPIFVEEIKGGSTPYSFEVILYTLVNMSPYTSEVTIQASYNNYSPDRPAAKDPRGSIAKVYILPAAQMHFVPPIKTATFKLTISTDKTIPPLNELFKEIVDLNPQNNIQESLTNPNAFSFILSDGVDCSVLISKNANKYRFQSSRFEGLWFVMSEVLHYAIQYYKQKGQALEIQYTDHVPLQDLFNVIDDHYGLRMELQSLKNKLEKKTVEFRTIQKRLLSRFKEKNPAPLNNLDILLQRSYEDIILLANKNEHVLSKLKRSSQILCVTLNLIHFLLKLRFSLSRQTYKLVQDIIPAKIINDEGEIGWEEITNANIIYLLKVALKKDMKAQKIQIEKIDDYSKFKKQMTYFFDKLSKGAF